ncbi:uncharacterized protein METZ01_LOCUS259224, partial [marine metagenome]
LYLLKNPATKLIWMTLNNLNVLCMQLEV